MNARALDVDRAAMVLADALFYGDAKAAERGGVTTRTLRRWRQRMRRDPELSANVRVKKDALASRWANDLAVGIRSACDFIRRACIEGDPKNPDMLRSVAGSLKIMADASFAERMLSARMNPTQCGPGGVVVLPAERDPDEAHWH